MSKCENCGAPLLVNVKGRRRRFCSNKCKLAARRSIAPGAHFGSRKTPLQGVSADRPKGQKIQEENQRAARPEMPISENGAPSQDRANEGSSGDHWERVNDVTWKLVGDQQVRVDRSHGQWAGYNTDEAKAWIIEIGWIANQSIWCARVKDSRGNWAFGPSTLSRARSAAVARVNHAPVTLGEGEHIAMGRLDLDKMAAEILDTGKLRNLMIVKE
jgi:hypothetical protein